MNDDESLIPQPNKYLTSGNIAELIALKIRAPLGKRTSPAYIRQVAASLHLRPETLAYYWSDEFDPSSKAEQKIAKKEEKIEKNELINRVLPEDKSKNSSYQKTTLHEEIKNASASTYRNVGAMRNSSYNSTSKQSATNTTDDVTTKDVDAANDSIDGMLTEQHKKPAPESIDDSLSFVKRVRSLVNEDYKTSFLFALRRAYQGVLLKDIVKELNEVDFGRFSENYLNYQLENKQKFLRVNSIDELYENICGDEVISKQTSKK